jgi:hypothetical protein
MNKEGMKQAQTGGEGEYQNWRELLGKSSASAEKLHKKIHATPEKTCHPKGQAMRSTEPGASNLLSLSGIRRRESRSIRLN